MFGRCHYCKAKASAAFLSDMVEDDALTESVQWCQWIRTVEGKTEKVQKSGTVGDALQCIADKLPDFKRHSFVKA